MSLSEALRIIIDADARGAVKGFTEVGRTAERELGKSDKSIDQLGRSMSKVGVGMLTTGAVIGGGLFKMAQASEAANLSNEKLENSIANNSRLAGVATSEFTDLAKAIQGKTAADADDIIAGQAVLAQGRLEVEQIKELTPLIVDLARKKGMDLVAANTLVAKAVDGNMSALKRANIQVDEAKFKTDAYSATVDALRSTVGGFAEQEGKTFAGQIERMKNQLGDIAEGVGAGAVTAFSDMIAPVQGLAEGFSELDPAVQSTVGRLLAYGAAGAIVVGGTATVIGKVLQMRETFNTAGISIRNAEGGLTKFGKAGAALSAIAIGAVIYQAHKEMTKFSVETEKVDKAIAKFRRTGDHMDLSFVLGKNEGLEGFRDLVEQNIGTAKRYRDALAESGTDTSKHDEILKEVAGTQRRLNEDQAAGTEIVDELTGAIDRNAEAQKRIQERLDRASAAAEKHKAALDGLLESTLAQFDANIRYAQSQNSTEDALTAVEAAAAKVRDGHGKDVAANEALERSLLEAQSVMLSQAAAAAEAAEQQAKLAGGTMTAADKAAIQRAELEKLRDGLDKNNPLRKNLDGYIYQLALVTDGHARGAVALQGYLGRAAKLNSLGMGSSTDALQNEKFIVRGLEGQRAMGGPASPHRSYLVGEHGPEILHMGSSAGTVTPNHELGSRGGSPTYVFHGDPPDAFKQAVWQHIAEQLDQRDRERGWAFT